MLGGGGRCSVHRAYKYSLNADKFRETPDRREEADHLEDQNDEFEHAQSPQRAEDIDYSFVPTRSWGLGLATRRGPCLGSCT